MLLPLLALSTQIVASGLHGNSQQQPLTEEALEACPNYELYAAYPQ